MQQVQQESIVKKIGKIGLLLSVKESYLFIRNSLGLAVHPFKTLRHLSLEKDRSQQLLIAGWPIYVLGLGLLGVWLGRRLMATTTEWGEWAKLSSVGVVGVSLLVGGYLVYWTIRVWRLK